MKRTSLIVLMLGVKCHWCGVLWLGGPSQPRSVVSFTVGCVMISRLALLPGGGGVGGLNDGPDESPGDAVQIAFNITQEPAVIALRSGEKGGGISRS